MLNQDVVREATRLTRAGQLVEAAALLQRMLQGDSARGPTSRSDALARAKCCGRRFTDSYSMTSGTESTMSTSRRNAAANHKRDAPLELTNADSTTSVSSTTRIRSCTIFWGILQ